jgi:hypothetical protein
MKEYTIIYTVDNGNEGKISINASSNITALSKALKKLNKQFGLYKAYIWDVYENQIRMSN